MSSIYVEKGTRVQKVMPNGWRQIEKLLGGWASVPVLFYCFGLRGQHEAGKKCAEISYFDSDLKTNTLVFSTDNLISD
jgi:hypothetical protein